ncbi:MAG: glycosyltransferase [Dehalococcoidia bacterium]
MSPSGVETHLRVSVIVPAYNAADTLPACLAALRSQTVPLEPSDIVVVDDGSTDGTAAVAEAFGVRLLRQEHENQATARNRGVRATSTDIVLFTDSDCEPAPDWVERMLDAFADPQVVGVKGCYRTRQPGLVPRFIQQEFEQKYEQLRVSRQLDFIDGYAAGYRRGQFLALGGFDPRYPPVEDIELSFRAVRSGHVLGFAPDAVVFHRHRDNLVSYARTKARAATLWVDVYRAHPTKLGNDSRQPRLVVAQICLAAAILTLSPIAAVSLPVRRLVALLGVMFLGSTVPLAARIAKDDAAVALAAPILTFVRSASQVFGIVRGAARRFRVSAGS